MANWHDSNHHNYNNDVEDAVHTRAAFHQFREETQQIIGEIQQMIAALLARKSSYNNNDQYIQRSTPNKKIALFDGDMCKLDFLDWLLDLEEYLNFQKICDEEKCGLHLINWTMKQINGGKTFKSIESDEVSIQSALDKE